ncbi:hypothetical protein [Microscilla marina]|uniref:Uncharacterized protein n=1 Tax=Microscilla marina ATCC 23134 TaxID=313606 RepID=A1ZRP8_MICM2|nr:hypothetical protein [Microscilla marina]EAY26953.1 hypothetical protein M23134_03604 [Microscilla marina ATCC 23134]
MTKPLDHEFKYLEEYGKGEEIFLRPDRQDRSGDAWEKLLALINQAVEEGWTEFAPGRMMPHDLWRQIKVLPNEIERLTQVTHLFLYGSSLERIPPHIGKMTSLKEFTPYTSYGLHWFPYEITRCKNLVDSTVSTRALYGNYKNRPYFPDLTKAFNQVEYFGYTPTCSVCNKQVKNNEYRQVWISLSVATDILPLLANICSDVCLEALPTPPESYIQEPHQGGIHQKQAITFWEQVLNKYEDDDEVE